MYSIFYDLETSGLNSINQILTYSFWCLDANWKVVSKLENKVRLQRTQLPEVSAILCNQIDVLRHKEEAIQTEREAVKAIHDFIWKVIGQNSTQTPLIGFQNFKFDWPFLRTTFIRNGMNPYFYGKIVHRDIHSIASKLYCTNQIQINKPEGKRILCFENIVKNLLNEEYSQEHTASQDVCDEIKVARYFAQDLGLDVRKYNAFEPQTKQNTVIKLEIDPQTGDVKEVPFVRLDTNKHQSLWIDTTKEGKDAVRWFNAQTSTFLIKEGREQYDADYVDLYSDYNLDNYFEDLGVDVEQRIAAIGFKTIDVLHEAIWNKNRSELEKLGLPELISLYNRNVLGHSKKEYGVDERFDKPFREYVQYRYGGKMMLQGFDIETGKFRAYPHPTYGELYENITKELTKEHSEKATNVLFSCIYP